MHLYMAGKKQPESSKNCPLKTGTMAHWRIHTLPHMGSSTLGPIDFQCTSGLEEPVLILTWL